MKTSERASAPDATLPDAVEVANTWVPPFSLEERIKYALIPAGLYMRYRARKEWLKGEAEIRLLQYFADSERNSVDVGANKGVYTWFLRNCSRKVYAFEPNPKLYRLLKRIEGGNVAVAPVALSDASGQAVFRLPRRRGRYSNQAGTLRTVNLEEDFEEFTVDTRRLDDLALGDIGFIKIDVEGFEQQVLDGARQTIARDRPVLLIELEERFTGQPIESSVARVESMGYRGMFLRRGRLTAVTEFDGDRDHRRPAHRRDYVFNFVFLPSR